MRKRNGMIPVFKPNAMGQMMLMAQSYDELIEEGHLVRVANEAAERI
jgi:hypothetical protein